VEYEFAVPERFYGLDELCLNDRRSVHGLEAGLPSLPDYSGAWALFPMLALPLDVLARFLFQTPALLTLSAASARFAGHPVYGSIVGFAILAMGVSVVPGGFHQSMFPWPGAALVGVAMVLTVVRFSSLLPALAPLILGTLAVADALDMAVLAPYPGARVGGLLAALLTGGVRGHVVPSAHSSGYGRGALSRLRAPRWGASTGES
jgi:hypothetical protein